MVMGSIPFEAFAKASVGQVWLKVKTDQLKATVTDSASFSWDGG
jgi:hypothetical protein